MTSSLKKLSVFFAKATRALQHREYRIFFYGQLLSLIGNWVTNIATAWLVYRLTGSAVLLGLVSFASQFPAFLVSPFAGVHVDRLNRRTVLIWTQALSSAQSFTLGVLTLTNVISVPWLIALGIFQALIDGFYIPARQSFVSDILTDRRDLPNAIALNSASFHFARLIGPFLGGILILSFGEGVCFVLDGISYLAVLCSLFFIRGHSPKPIGTKTPILAGLMEGVRYIQSEPLIATLLSFVSLMCFFGIAHTVLLPVLVASEFAAGPHVLGILMGASGGGAFLGALALASRSSTKKLLPSSLLAGCIFGLAVIALGFSTSVLVSSLSLVLCGFAFITVAAGCNTLIQTTVQDAFRGRVMSFFAMSFTGMMPLGALLFGQLAELYGVRNTYILSGISALGIALLHGYIVQIRHRGRYIRM